MYKLLIVDDERWIRRGIRAKLSKHGFHFSWIGEADSGVAALRTMEEVRPDIVLVDIKMDGMDGLGLMQQARQLRLGAKFVVISGHSNFSYAEQAINEGARGYILKPIESRLFVQRLQSVIIELDQEQERKGSPEEILGASAVRDVHAVPEVSALGLASDENMAGQFCALGIIHIDGISSKSWTAEVRAREAIRRQLAAVLLPVLQRRGIPLYEDKRSASNLIFLCTGNAADQVQTSLEDAVRIVRARASSSAHSITIGCSDAATGVTHALYARARIALDRRLVEGAGAVYHFTDDHEFRPVDEQDLRFLEQHIHHRNIPEMRRRIHEILASSRSGSYTVAYLRDAYVSVVQTVMRSIGPADRSVIVPHVSVLMDEDFDMFDSARQLADHLCDAIERALCGGACGNDSTEGDKVEQICRYIADHFSFDISTQQLASQFHLNANYLSTLFRKRTGVTISAYVTQVRMNAACRLLRETSLSVTQTAEAVGYFDPKYFHKVFKKTKGLTPGEFREGNSH